jgi:hypothetical protein
VKYFDIYKELTEKKGKENERWCGANLRTTLRCTFSS